MSGELEKSPDHFDDPALKAAVRRAWAEERAPADLRQRISAAGVGGVSPAMPRRRPWPVVAGFYALAAAAMVLIAVGIVWRSYRPVVTHSITPIAAALPASLADELVARHDECCLAKDHHMPGLSRDNLTLIASELRRG